MFPTDKGASASTYVSRIAKMLRESGVSYKLNAMGTVVETTTLEEAQLIVNQSYDLLKNDCSRVYCTVTFDIRDGELGRMYKKVASVIEKAGDINT